MGTLPTIVSKEDVRVGGIDVYSNPDQAGAQIGRAVQGFGSAVSSLSGTVKALQDKDKERKSRFEVASAIANTDMGKVANEVQATAPADGKGMADETFKQQKDLIDKNANEMQFSSDEARMDYRTTMYQRLPGWRDRATATEYTQNDAYEKNAADQGLNTLTNRVRSDPTQYDATVKDAEALIDAGKYSEGTKIVMKQQLRSDIATARFESMIGAADDDDDFVRLEAELKDERWQKEMTPEQYDRTIGAIKTSRSAFLSGQDTQARSILTGMEERSKAREIIPDEEIQEMNGLMNKAKSPSVTTRFVKVLNEQQILRQYKDASPAQIDQAVKSQKKNEPQLRGAVGQWASDASAVTGGEIPASYLISKLGIEYSAKDIKEGKYNEPNKAGDSSAQGLFQFIKGTWIDMMQRYGSRFGYDPGKMGEKQMLALRGDPGLSAKMAALYALENKRAMQKAGIQPNDTDLYLAHFLGSGGAISFLKARNADPVGTARPYGDFTQDQINANKGVFIGKKGVRLSYTQVYNNLARKMAPGTQQAKFDNVQYLETMRDSKQTAVNKDPILQFQTDGKMGQYDLNSPSTFGTRGQDALAAANYYNIPTDEMKPFTEQEAAVLKKGLMEGNSDQQLQLMAYIANMDRNAPGMAKAAYAQLGEKDSVLGYSASLMYDKNESATAAQIVRGQKAIKEDKTLAGAFGGDGDASSAFYETMGGSLQGMTPAMRDAIFQSAKAHYAETYATRGNLEFDAEQFKLSAQAVLGGSQGEPVAEVNSVPTVMPQGISADTFETALDGMTDADLAMMSVDQVPPKDLYGEVVPARDIADEGQFIWVGRNMYKVRMSDGAFLTTGETDPDAPYMMKAFVFVAHPHLMKKLAGKETPEMSPEAQENLSMQDQTGLGGGQETVLPGEYAQ